MNGSVLVNDDKRKDKWREYFEKLYIVVRQEDANVNTISFGGVANNMYRGVEPISMREVKML